MTNCKNCGAALDNENIKCPYCGTLYFDLSTIPLNTPFILTINVGTESQPKIITSRAVCDRLSIDIAPDKFPTAEMGFVFLKQIL